MFVADSTLAYLIIFVLPIIIYYFFKFKGRVFIIYVVLSLAFTAGSIELLTKFEVHRVLQICELLIWALTFYILLITPKRYIPYWPYLACFVFICFVSHLINPVNFIQLALFLRKYLLLVALFVLFHNIKLFDKDRENLLKFIVFLFLTQIIVNIARYPLTGQTEEYIGTMSIRGGSITAIFALVGIAFAFSAYLYTKKYLYLILIFGFFVFSVIGAKRGHFFFLPILLFTQYFIYLRFTNLYFWKNVLKYTPIVLIITGLLIYFGFTLVPSLNPENIMGGSFEPAYVLKHVDEYLNPGRPIAGITYFGRGEAPRAVYDLLQNNGTLSLFFGLGPGDIIVSRFTIPADIVGSEELLTGMKYGIGYGVRTGVLFTIMQVGILGTLFYFIFIFKVFLPFFRKQFYLNDMSVDKKIISLGLVGYLGIFIFDFFAYSQTSFQIIPIILPICFAYHYVISQTNFNVQS